MAEKKHQMNIYLPEALKERIDNLPGSSLNAKVVILTELGASAVESNEKVAALYAAAANPRAIDKKAIEEALLSK